jgi:hypothetical protein
VCFFPFAIAFATSTENVSTRVLGRLTFRFGNRSVSICTIGTISLWSVVLSERSDSSSYPVFAIRSAAARTTSSGERSRVGR